MTTNGRVPIGDTGWVRLEGKEAEEFIEALDKYEANEEALWAMRPALLREHPGETVLVTDAGATVQFFPDMGSPRCGGPVRRAPGRGARPAGGASRDPDRMTILGRVPRGNLTP